MRAVRTRLSLRPLGLVIVACTVCAVIAANAAAEAPVQPYGTNDAGGFANVLPAGENGLDNGTQLAEFELKGTFPPHFADQLPLYAGLLEASPTLTHEQIPTYFKDATFGVKAGEVASPKPHARTSRSCATAPIGVPHIYGSTRGGVMFGAGYAAAADRLFFMDVLRHAARAELSSFAGGAEGNRAMDRAQWSIAPYTEADLQSQIENGPKLYGAAGEQAIEDGKEFVAGINAYINAALLNPNLMPVRVRRARQAADRMEADRRDRRGVVDRRHLRQGRRRRGALRACAGGIRKTVRPQPPAGPRGRTSASTTTPRRRPPSRRAFPYETGSPFATTGLAMPDPGSVSFISDGELVEPPAGASHTSAIRGAQMTDTPSAAADPQRRLDRLAAVAPGARRLRRTPRTGSSSTPAIRRTATRSP